MQSFGLVQKHVAFYETFAFPCESYKISCVAKTQIQLPDTVTYEASTIEENI